jgi:UDP-N-acetyl-D-mannosaminuronate dehydrogenase
MDMKSDVLVVGLGEVGKPLLDVLSSAYEVSGRDLDPLAVEDVRVMHICYPFQIDDFIGTSINYIQEYQPDLVIINSTALPGTTRKIHELTQIPTVFSPVRGKHIRMKEELLHYTKFVAGTDQEATSVAREHFEKAGLNVETIKSPETLELAKLLETTYFGLLVAWAQETERFCNEVDADYDEVMKYTKEIGYLPPVIFQPGFIGGHCVLPNIQLLEQLRPSDFTEAIRISNELKAKEWELQGKSLEDRISPKPK